VQTLTTDRLSLRPLAPDDADFLFDMYSRWEVQRFIGREPRVMTAQTEAEAIIARNAGSEHPVHGVWVITDQSQGTPFGVLLLKPLPASGQQVPLLPSGEIEIGWHLHPDAWGHGYASEAVQHRPPVSPPDRPA